MEYISPEWRRRQRRRRRRLALLLPSSLQRCQTGRLQSCSNRSRSLTPLPFCWHFPSRSAFPTRLSLARSPVVSFYDQPFLFSAPLTNPPPPPHLRLIDLSWVSGGKYKSSHCHFKQRDNQTLGCPLTTRGNWPWL